MNIKVGQLTYSVSMDAAEPENGRCGVSMHQLSEIRISPHLSEGEYRTTLLHEVMHACANFAGISDKEKLDEENYISRISPILLTVLCENEELCNALCLA